MRYAPQPASMEAPRCTGQHTPATVLVSDPVPYLDLVQSIKGLARKPTPRRVRLGDHARKELLPYLAHLPTIFSLPLQKHLRLRLRPATRTPSLLGPLVSIEQKASFQFSKSTVARIPTDTLYLILDTPRISRQVHLLRRFVLTKTALCAQPKRTAPRSPSPLALD